MPDRIPGFRGEYLWELDVPRIQLAALAEAVPAEKYVWRPAPDSRTFSAVLVHVAAGNMSLLKLAGVPVPLYEGNEGDALARIIAIVRKNVSLEGTLTDKPAVTGFLKDSFEAVRQAMTAASEEDLERDGIYFGERATVRRVYMRLLAHAHEHMGQAIAYTRAMGLRVPWPNPLEELDRMAAEAGRG